MICDKRLLCYRRKGRIKCSRTINRINYSAHLRIKNKFLSSFSVSLCRTWKINGQRVRHRAGGLSESLPPVRFTDCQNSGTKPDTEKQARGWASACIFQGWSIFLAGCPPSFEAGSSLPGEVTRWWFTLEPVGEFTGKAMGEPLYLRSLLCTVSHKDPTGCHFPMIWSFHITSSTYRTFQKKKLLLPVCTEKALLSSLNTGLSVMEIEF